MYSAVTVAGLVGLATAAYSQGPAGYETTTSSAPAAYSSSAPAVYSSSSPAGYESSSAPAAYGSSSSSAAAYGSSSSAAGGYASSASSASSYYASSTSSSAYPTGTPDCWNTCFEKNDITSEADLCGNTDVNECIYYTCCKEDDMKYWSWYDSYCPAPSSPASSSSSSPATYGSSTWATVTYSASSTSASATPTGNCWNACFEEFNVESEAELCGNDDVSKCIAVTCSSELDQAYWNWYNGFCSPSTSTGVTTYTSVCTPLTPITTPMTVSEGTTTWATYNTEPYTTTWVETTTYPGTPVSSPATTGWPTPSGPAAYTSPVWTAPYSYPATGVASSPVTTAATGYGASPTQSGWVPVAATGAGAANKPAGLFAVVLALVAFF